MSRAALFNDNAVLLKDLRSRMRGARPFLAMAANCALMALVTGIWWLSYDWLRYGRPGSSEPGRELLSCLVFVQGIVISLLAPALSAGSFTLEREQQTFELLLLTPMSPLRMVWGRILSIGVFLLLMITTALPFVSLSFVLGGLSPGELIAQYVALAIGSFLLSALGVLCSVTSARTPFSVGKTYFASAALCLAVYACGDFYSAAVPPGPTPRVSPVVLLDFYGGCLMSTGRAAFFNGTIPAWWMGLVIGLGALVLLVMLCANNFPSREGSLGGTLRVVNLALFLTGYVTAMGWLWGDVTRAVIVGPATPMGRPGSPLMSPHRMMANGLIGIGWLLIGIFTPFVCSRSIHSCRDSVGALVAGALNPRAWLKPRLRSSLGYVFLAASCTLPLVALAFLIGGVGLTGTGVGFLWRSYAYGYALLGFIALTTILGCIVFRPHRLGGVACGYAAIVGVLIVPMLPMIVDESMGSRRLDPPPSGVDALVFNPVMVGVANSTLKRGPQQWRNGAGPRSNLPLKEWWRVGALGYFALDVLLAVCIAVCCAAMKAREESRAR